LAAAILAQAFSDMFLTDSSEIESVDTVAVHAMRYLTDRHGQSAYWRNKWCSYLDLDGDTLATRVRMILDGLADPPGYDARFSQRLDRARDRWARISQVRPSDLPKRLPIVKPDPPFDLRGIDLQIPDDPFFVTQARHIRASRRWHDGETSRFLGPLPSIHSKIGEALWAITQVQRAGANAIKEIEGLSLIDGLREALPACEIGWTVRGKRLSGYQLNAGLRVYLKQFARTA
jgi:hypothetical protein